MEIVEILKEIVQNEVSLGGSPTIKVTLRVVMMIMIIMMMMIMVVARLSFSGTSFRSSSLPDPFSREALQPAADYILVILMMMMIR